jgi:hypothetical protein
LLDQIARRPNSFETVRETSASRSFTYSTYSCSARGIASRYQPDQSPDLSPPTSRIAERQGSKTKMIRISAEPAEPGLSSLIAISEELAGRLASGPVCL